MTGIETYLTEASREVEAALDRLLPKESEEPRELHEAMRYSVFAGGKRVRPALALLFCEALGRGREAAMGVAAAFECVHVYSLIHDDLPAMDDDDFRRGKPSNHKAFGEALAILAGDALLTLAFELAAGAPDRGLGAELALELARAAGAAGMVGGQVLDIRSEGKTRVPPSRDGATLEAIHRRKTAALIRGASRAGALAGGAGPAELAAATRYGEALGLAFQVVDDILDVECTSEELGKTAGKDAAAGKLTYPALYGLDEAKRRARALVDEAQAALEELPPSDARERLRELAILVRDRRK
jgi:geranylgeranyl diphosphate synthase type II